VKQATKITQPGITERRLVRENGHWSVLCERTGVDGIKQCKLYRIDEQNAKLIKIPIETNEVEVLKGATVNVENVPGLNGTSAVRQTVQPLVEKYATMRRLPAQDTGITFHRLPRASDIDTATGEPRITSVAEFDNQQLGTNYVSTQTNGGSADVKQGGAMNKKKGGAVTVPDPRKLFYHQFKLTDLDVKDAQQRLPDGTVAMPNEWANLGLDPLGANPGDVEYYAYDDDYGTTALHSKKTGFEFHFRYLPLSVEQEKSYLEWLIGVSMRMRIQHPQHFQFLYDSNVDTIATLEANILNGLARLEAHKVLFSRPKLFGGAASHENQLHKLLRIYALKPPTPIWISPMSMKYTNLPGQVQPDGTITRVASADVPEPESIVQNTLLDIRDELVDLAQNGGGFLDERGTGVKFPTFEGPDTTFADGVLAVGVLEAQVMSMLASLQFRYGLVVNFSAFGSDTDGGSYEATLMDNRRKKYLSADLKRYLDAFSNPADTRIFIRLPELRLRQAEAANIRLPPSTIPNVRKFSVNDSVTVVPTGIPASVETVVLTR
jgi:hypothetical protein